MSSLSQSIHGPILENCRDILEPNEENGWSRNHEIDIWLPELNTAIEYNGNYFHDYVKFPDAKENDDFKKIQCESKGIKLITIWEQDWIERQEETKEMLKQKLLCLK